MQHTIKYFGQVKLLEIKLFYIIMTEYLVLLEGNKLVASWPAANHFSTAIKGSKAQSEKKKNKTVK